MSVQRCESEQHRSCSMPVEGFRNHVAADGSLFGVSGKWSACVCSVVQLGCDEEMEPMHGMYGTLDSELEVQRTTKRDEMTAFLCLFGRIIGPTTTHAENKGILVGLWRGWRKSGPARFSEEQRRRTRTCSARLAFTVWWRSGSNCEEPKPWKKKGGIPKKEAEKHRTEWCAAKC